jgi:hypothetical protein
VGGDGRPDAEEATRTEGYEGEEVGDVFVLLISCFIHLLIPKPSYDE